MKKVEKKTNKQIAEQAIGLGTLAQVSRNQKINNLGGLFGIAGLIILVGELIKLPIKWLIIKPCILVVKGFWLSLKYGVILYKMLFQYSYKGMKVLFNKYKIKKQLEK